METAVDVSIIILSYNTAELLKNCVDSVLQHTKEVNLEIIVVDNNSSDESPQVAQSYGDKVKFIQSHENGGFSKGNNIGIRVARGRFVLLLNPDTLFIENTLYRMVIWMDAHHDVAVSSCQLLDANQKISPTGGYEPTMLRVIMWAFFLDDIPGISHIVNSYHPRGGASSRYAKEFFPDWVTGAFFMMSHKALEHIGLLDENIFLYGEELEWCIRAKQFGWKVGYTPITKIVHLERKSSKSNPERAILGEIKGLRYIYQKYYPPKYQYLLDIILVLAEFLRVWLWLVRLKPRIALIYLKAMVI